MQLTAFNATMLPSFKAERVDVDFDAGVLSIHGLTIDEAMMAISQLESGAVRFEKPPQLSEVRVPARHPEPVVDPEAIKALASSSPAAPPKAEKPAAAKKPPKRTATEDAAEPEAELSAQLAASLAPAEAPKTNGAATHAEPEEAAPAAEGDTALVAALTPMVKLRDVLAHLQDTGIKELSDLRKECARLKERVPVLSRIANLDDRVERTLAVMDRGDE